MQAMRAFEEAMQEGESTEMALQQLNKVDISIAQGDAFIILLGLTWT
jgi:hypothetical protein